LVYPAVLIFAAIVALGVIMTVLLPTLMPIFTEAGATPPLPIRALAHLSEILVAHWPAVLGAGALAIAATLWVLQEPRVRGAFDHFLLRLPILGRIISQRETARFSRTLSMLTRNGVPLLDAVRTSSGVLSNRAFADAVRAAGEEIKEGATLSQPLARSGLFPELFLRLAVVGEQTGQLDTMLARVADVYEAAVQRQIQTLTTLITPVLTLVIGAIVGGLILSVMGAILSINDLALQ
jgi:general secretion pathway protein F